MHIQMHVCIYPEFDYIHICIYLIKSHTFKLDITHGGYHDNDEDHHGNGGAGGADTVA